jgi:hypothetical protein
MGRISQKPWHFSEPELTSFPRKPQISKFSAVNLGTLGETNAFFDSLPEAATLKATNGPEKRTGAAPPQQLQTTNRPDRPLVPGCWLWGRRLTPQRHIEQRIALPPTRYFKNCTPARLDVVIKPLWRSLLDIRSPRSDGESWPSLSSLTKFKHKRNCVVPLSPKLEAKTTGAVRRFLVFWCFDCLPCLRQRGTKNFHQALDESTRGLRAVKHNCA